jgi:hypothetical protein
VIGDLRLVEQCNEIIFNPNNPLIVSIMKKENVPQDMSSLGKITKEVCYATDSTGKYVTELSSGWDVKINALDVAWKDIEERTAKAKQRVLNGEASPLLFFMEYRLMDISILSDYAGFWKWQIKRHLKPEVFNKLSDKKLQKYAAAFNIKVEDLKTMTVNEA